MNSLIPIFPLNLVIYPGSIYPLHIFEERYKKMINRVFTTDEGFGIVSVLDSEISKVGCLCKVEKIIRKYNDGKMDIYVKGYERFNTISSSVNTDGYFESHVEPYRDKDSSYNTEILFEVALSRFTELLAKTKNDIDDFYFDNLERTKLKSYKLAEKSGLDLRQQQDLLIIKSEKERLIYISNHLEKLNKFIDSDVIVDKLVIGDGYINN